MEGKASEGALGPVCAPGLGCRGFFVSRESLRSLRVRCSARGPCCSAGLWVLWVGLLYLDRLWGATGASGFAALESGVHGRGTRGFTAPAFNLVVP